VKKYTGIRVEKGTMKFLEDCKEALIHSELGKRYFANEKAADEAIREGIQKDSLYIALHNDECVGFMFYIPNGVFHAFSYLHLIAIKYEHRRKGIGTYLMSFLEDLVFVNNSKLFLVVADFNPKGKKFYERRGYIKVGEIPSLYRDGITENLMMKTKPLINEKKSSNEN